MTLPEVGELCGYWADHPPVHLMLSGVLGIGPRGRPTRRDRPGAPSRGIEAFLAELGPGMAIGEVDAGMPPVLLDFEQLKIASEAGMG
jgi:hypothetical protein